MLGKLFNNFNDTPSFAVRRATTGARVLLSIGLCIGLTTEAFGQATTDIQVAMQGPTDAPAGQPVTYRAIVSNAGPAAADGASFMINIVPPLTNQIATCDTPSPGAGCTPPNDGGPGQLFGTVPTLPPNSTISIAITGSAPGGTISATVRADPPSGVTDTDNGNNEASATTLPVALQTFDVQ